jgi:chemotaxis response regulator CheB
VGLDAYKRLLQNLPADIGAAIVIVNHVRRFATMLHSVLPHFASMPVSLITEGMVLKPNEVFIIPEIGISCA